MNWNDFYIKFKLQNEGEQFWVNHRTEKVMNCSLEDGELDFSCKYSFPAESPLHLKAKAKIGDDIRVHMLPYRIELYVNGKLEDEEWPRGNHYLKDCMLTDNGCELRLESAE